MLRRVIPSMIVGVLIFFALPFCFGIAYAAAGAISGLAIITVLILIQYPMMCIFARQRDTPKE